MTSPDNLSWDESVEFVRRETNGIVKLLRGKRCIWLEKTGSDMTVELQDDLVCNPNYLADVLASLEDWSTTD
jgi:hypothetical protein